MRCVPWGSVIFGRDVKHLLWVMNSCLGRVGRQGGPEEETQAAACGFIYGMYPQNEGFQCYLNKQEQEMHGRGLAVPLIQPRLCLSVTFIAQTRT